MDDLAAKKMREFVDREAEKFIGGVENLDGEARAILKETFAAGFMTGAANRDDLLTYVTLNRGERREKRQK